MLQKQNSSTQKLKFMKLNLITVIAIMITITIAVGTASAQSVNLGIKGGLNVYTLSGNADATYDPKASFHAGLLGHIHVVQHFAIQPEVLFSRQGTKYDKGLKMNLDYINVPVLFQYMFDNGFRLQAGPQAGFLLAAKSNEQDVKDYVKGIELGISIGASYVNPPTGWGVDARFNQGITDITESTSTESYNRGFQLGVFYLFKHKS